MNTIKIFFGEPRPAVVNGLFAIVLALTALVYYPGLSGGFLFDDFFNIVDNRTLYIETLSWRALREAALSSDAGMLKRPLSMLSFALNGYFGGITAGNLKTTNLVLHLINGTLVFLLARLTFQSAGYDLREAKNACWPLLAAALWLAAPINLTSVLYVVQRMTSLAALFTFAGLYAYVRLRMRQIGGRGGTGAIILVLLLFAALSALAKENGVLLPVFALCYELTVLQFKTQRRSEKNALLLLFFFTCAVPFGLLVYLLYANPETLLGGYAIRDFTLTERLLTEARLIWFYLRLICLPSASLLGMYHDDFPLSHSLLSPFTTSFALAGIAALMILAIRLRKKQPLLALGILLFFAGHGMESTFFPLEIAHEHRNYFPAFGIILSIAAAARQLLQNRGYALMIAAVIAFMAVTGVRASLWENPLELALMEVQHHPLSPRSNYEAARFYTRLMDAEKRPDVKKDYYLTARSLYLKSAELEASHISGLLGVIWLDSLFGAASDEQIIRLASLRLAEQKITPATSGNLHRLHECEMSNQCTISGELVYDLQLAAIGNPKTPSAARVSMMSEASARALKLNRFQEALAIAYDAAKYSPENAQLGINYAALLIHAQLYDVAKTELGRVALLPLDPGMTRQFERQRALLTELSAQASDAK